MKSKLKALLKLLLVMAVLVVGLGYLEWKGIIPPMYMRGIDISLGFWFGAFVYAILTSPHYQ